jgi:hypothetical protein
MPTFIATPSDLRPSRNFPDTLDMHIAEIGSQSYSGDANLVMNRDRFRLAVTSVALGAISTGHLTEDDFLLREMHTNYSYRYLKSLDGNATITRRRQLAAKVLEGSISVSDFRTESDAVRYFQSNQVRILDKNGIHAGTLFGESSSISGFRGYQIDKLEDKVREAISSLPCNARANQHQVSYNEYGSLATYDDRVFEIHSSFGHRDSVGDYKPLLTVLNENHPVSRLIAAQS